MSRAVSRSRDVRGVTVPSFFYGTAWKEQRTAELTQAALDAGFGAIDTANQRRHYVEAAVGEAVAATLEAGQRTRAELFLQTKFTHVGGHDHRMPYDHEAHPAMQVEQSFQSSLEHLRTSYVDSYVLHGPSRSQGLSDYDWEVWRAMERLQKAGKARLVGISNVVLEQLTALCDGASVPPAFVQNRCFARDGWDRELRAFCLAHDIVYQGFSLLTANARALEHPAIAALAARKQRSVPELVFRFALEVGMIPLTGTSSSRHMRADLACFDFELADDDVALIERVAKLR